MHDTHTPPLPVQALLAEMLGWGVAPDLRCYEALIDAHAHHGDGAAAVRVLDRIEAAGLAATHETYRRLLHGLGATGDLRRAAQVCMGGARGSGLGVGAVGGGSGAGWRRGLKSFCAAGVVLVLVVVVAVVVVTHAHCAAPDPLSTHPACRCMRA
jgi:pentatricopeptide repeat protein